MLFYIGFISCIVGAMINQRKLIKKDKVVFLIYLLALLFSICSLISKLCITIYSNIEQIEQIMFFESYLSLLPIIIVFLTALNIRRKRKWLSYNVSYSPFLLYLWFSIAFSSTKNHFILFWVFLGFS